MTHLTLEDIDTMFGVYSAEEEETKMAESKLKRIYNFPNVATLEEVYALEDGADLPIGSVLTAPRIPRASIVVPKEKLSDEQKMVVREFLIELSLWLEY